MKRHPRIIETENIDKKLLGTCHLSSGTIRITPNQSPISFLTTLVHELLHREQTYLKEETVEEISCRIASALWNMDYRRVSQ